MFWPQFWPSWCSGRLRAGGMSATDEQARDGKQGESGVMRDMELQEVFVSTNRRTKALLYFKRLRGSSVCHPPLLACVSLFPDEKKAITMHSKHMRKHGYVPDVAISSRWQIVPQNRSHPITESFPVESWITITRRRMDPRSLPPINH